MRLFFKDDMHHRRETSALADHDGLEESEGTVHGGFIREAARFLQSACKRAFNRHVAVLGAIHGNRRCLDGRGKQAGFPHSLAIGCNG